MISTRAVCVECVTSVIVQADGAVFRCNCCEAIIINSVSPGSQLGVSAATTKAPAPEPMVVAATFSVSDGVGERSLPSGEIEPSVMLASAPFEFSSCDGVETRRNARLAAAVRPPPGGPAGFAPGSHDSIPTPILSSPLPPTGSETSAPFSIEAAPPFSSDPYGVIAEAPAFREVFAADLEAAIAALEAEWLAQGISLADCIVKNSTTLRVVAASDSISKSFSVAGA